MLRLIVNATLFNLGWLGCVFASRWGIPLAALGPIGVLCAIHLFWTMEAPRRLAEVHSILAVALIGITVDVVNLGSGVLLYDGGSRVSMTYVLWIGAFWVNFSMLLNVALRWLAPRPLLGAVIGAVLAPATYAGGEALGALEIGAPRGLMLAIIGAEWLVLLPALSILARRLNPPSNRARHEASERVEAESAERPVR